MILYINIAQITLAAILIGVILLQSKEAGLGGLSGGDTGGVYRARRVVEKILFYFTIAISVMFFGLAIATTLILK